jgi:uncharacterized membrane protein
MTGLRILTLATVLGTATAGGVFFAFSAFVMAGLDRLPPAGAVAAMQQINVTAVRPAFMAVLFGSAAACVVLLVQAARSWGGRPSTLLAAGSALYLAGVVGLTIGYHVPRNDALAAFDPARGDAAAAWAAYAPGWTALNHVRTVAALLAAALLLLALLDQDA